MTPVTALIDPRQSTDPSPMPAAEVPRHFQSIE